MEIVYRKIEDLIPYVNNTRTHTEEQVNQVASSIKEFNFTNPVLIDKDGGIIAGHCRVLAGKKLKLKEVPCIELSNLTEAQKKAYIIADNKLALNAGWNEELLKIEIEALKELDFDLDLLGFDNNEIDDILGLNESAFDKFKDGCDENVIGLGNKYIVPPFSILDTKQGYWKERKANWQQLIEDDGKSRGCVIGKDFGVSLLDPVMSELMIKWYAPKESENKIFDCFAGDTVFGFVASHKNNNFTGIELREEQAKFNNKTTSELANYICDDGRNVCKHIEKESQDMFFSCPPYFDLEVYSDKKEDASNQETYEEFYQILDKAFSESIKCLKENRFAVVVAGDVRNKKTGEYYDFIGSIKETFKRNGMKLYNELIMLDPIGTAPLRANKFSVSRKNVKIHQNIVVFYKGDTNKISKEFYNIQEEYNNDSENE